jgi:hypothetical protein
MAKNLLCRQPGSRVYLTGMKIGFVCSIFGVFRFENNPQVTQWKAAKIPLETLRILAVLRVP